MEVLWTYCKQLVQYDAMVIMDYGWEFHSHLVVQIVLEITGRLRNTDAEPAFHFHTNVIVNLRPMTRHPVYSSKQLNSGKLLTHWGRDKMVAMSQTAF